MFASLDPWFGKSDMHAEAHMNKAKKETVKLA